MMEAGVLVVLLAAGPSFADWIRETTRAAGAGAEFVDQAGRRGRIRPSGPPVRPDGRRSTNSAEATD